MKIIILCAVIVTVLIQEASADKKVSGLKCHYCVGPPNCKFWNTVTCPPHEDVCQRTHRNIVDPGEPSGRNDYASTTKGVMVWERLCNTKQACETAKKRTRKVSTVTCCGTSMCNA